MPIKWNTYEQINHRFAGLQLKCVIFSRVNSILMGFLHLILNVQRQPSKSTKRHVFISPQKTAISMAHSKCQSCEFVVGLLVWSRCTGSIFEVFFAQFHFVTLVASKMHFTIDRRLKQLYASYILNVSLHHWNISSKSFWWYTLLIRQRFVLSKCLFWK